MEVIKHIRSINEELNSDVCILQDLQGPKLRIGLIENDAIEITKGQILTLTSNEMIGNAEKICIRYVDLANDVKPGEFILIDDGKIELKIERILNETDVEASVVTGGTLKSKKGFNLPHTDVSFPSLTEKDILDLQFGLENDIEWIGLSFVRKAEDIIDLKARIAAAGKESKVIAKIEKPEAVANIDDIIEVTDGIMVARGDLGVEMPLQDLPIIQKTSLKNA